MQISVDVGGTFTDFVIVDEEDNRLMIHKVSSSGTEPYKPVIDGLRELNIDVSKVKKFVHGFTIACNTIIQRRGAKVGLITTKGFRDVLEIMRITRGTAATLYDSQWEKPKPLVPRPLRMEVDERLNSTGKVLKELDEEEVKKTVEYLKNQNVQSIAVSLLFSYTNPIHERKIESIIRENFPETCISASVDVQPEFREYERTSTVVADAYVKPIVGKYLRKLHVTLEELGYKHDLLIMKCDGGVMTAEVASEYPIQTYLSGPVGGVVAGKFYSELTGYRNLITTDMGGTSFDVSLIRDGTLSYSSAGEVEQGVPIRMPMVDVRTIGAGGGSIAWIDLGGALKVGPVSAGSDPGPACYGKGGTEPTVTDANVVLGRLDPNYFLGGKIKLSFDLAYRAIKHKIADITRMSVYEAAQGILDVTTSNMVQAIRRISVEKGYDPREFVLLSFGGAGPLHATAIAKELDIGKIIVPPYPGATSAMGLLLADLRFDYVTSHLTKLEKSNLDAIREIFGSMIEKGKEMLRREGYSGTPLIFNSIDMRYEGQSYEINIEIPKYVATSITELQEKFDQEHNRLYGFSSPDALHEIINLRTSIVGKSKLTDMTKFIHKNTKRKFLKTQREAYEEGSKDFLKHDVYERHNIPFGTHIEGPAIIEQVDSTTYLPAESSAFIDQFGDIAISMKK